MKLFIKSPAAAASFVLLSFCNAAFADVLPFPLPEPGSLSLVGLAVVVAAVVLRRKK